MNAHTQLHNLSDCNITYNNYGDFLLYELDFNDVLYKAKITQTDLKSGFVDLKKLSNIIQLNSKQTLPNYSINLISTKNTSDQNILILQISYSNEFIEFDEQINFYPAVSIEETNLDKYNDLIKLQEKKIKQQEEKIISLEKRLGDIEKNQFIVLQEIGIEPGFHYKNVSKNIDKLEIVVKRDLQTEISMPPERVRLCLSFKLFDEVSEFFSYDIPVKFKNVFLIPIKDDICNHGHRRIDHILIRSSKQKTEQVLDRIDGEYLFLNFNSIVIKCNHVNLHRELYKISYFVDEYLSKKKDFVVGLIETIYNSEMVPILLKHTNYKKLLIKYDKEFNDEPIKTHCKKNNIIFGYIE